MLLEPFTLRAGKLFLEQADLAELTSSLEGGAAWVLSHAALSHAIAAANGPRTVAMSVVGPREVLAMLASAGWWARVRSSNELRRARAAGFEPACTVASGRVKDDGFVRDALADTVAVMESADEADARNVARIAGALDHPVPPGGGAPPEAPAGVFERCGGLLAPVLHEPPMLALDAVWEEAGPVGVWALQPGEPEDGSLAGLSPYSTPCPAVVHGPLRRGDWAAVPSPRAAALRPVDAAHSLPETLLVRGTTWRVLEPVPLPGPGG